MPLIASTIAFFVNFAPSTPCARAVGAFCSTFPRDGDADPPLEDFPAAEKDVDDDDCPCDPEPQASALRADVISAFSGCVTTTNFVSTRARPAGSTRALIR